jgi:hypothetical protein
MHYQRCLFASVVALFTPSRLLATDSRTRPLDIGIGCGHGDYPHPKGVDPVVTRLRITEPLADFIMVHFAFIRLPSADFIVLRGQFNSTLQVTTERIVASSDKAFFSRPLYTTQVDVELHSYPRKQSSLDQPRDCFGFHIDGLRVTGLDGNRYSVGVESICGTDDSVNSKCVVDARMRSASKSVVRLLTNRVGGSAFCSGWLLGCEGHLITNNHCIANQEDATNTQFEFMAEGLSCTDKCNIAGACSQNEFARSATLVTTSVALDYSLVKLEGLPADIGYTLVHI